MSESPYRDRLHSKRLYFVVARERDGSVSITPFSKKADSNTARLAAMNTVGRELIAYRDMKLNWDAEQELTSFEVVENEHNT
jgi:hypothetical protein